MNNYEDIGKKLQELENRIYNMEARQAKMERGQTNAQAGFYQQNNTIRVQPNIRPQGQSANQQASLPPQGNAQARPIEHRQNFNMGQENITHKKPNNSFGENLIGKYIIGGLASLLIFIAAISLFNLMWIYLSNEQKFYLVAMIGLLISAIGLYFTKKTRNYVWSIVLAIGTGLVYISIIFAYITLSLISSTTCIVLITIWSIALMLISKFIKAIYTSIIAYVGIYITIIFALPDSQIQGDYLFILGFAALTFITMFIINFKELNKRKISLLLGLTSFYLILAYLFIYEHIASFFGNKTTLKSGNLPATLTILIIYIVSNYIYYLFKEKKIIAISAFINVTTSIMTVCYLSLFEIILKDFIFLELLLLINILQLLVNLIFYKKIKEFSLYYYISFISVIVASLFDRQLLEPGGIVFVVLFLIIIEQVFKLKNHKIFISTLIIIDTILCLTSKVNLIYIVIKVLQICATIFLLLYNHQKKDYKHFNFLKKTSLLITLVNAFTIPYSLKILYKLDKKEAINLIAYFLMLIILIASVLLGFYKRWSDDGFKLLSRNSSLENDKKMLSFLYISSTIIYILSLFVVHSFNDNLFRFLFLIVSLSIALLQSFLLVNKKNINESNKGFIGIWLGVKYLIFVWNTLSAYSYLRIDTTIYSLSGMVVAVIAIFMGFIYLIKSLRMFGLVLIILMVLKFVLIDLSWHNSIMRIISFIIAGLLCLGISFLYNKINLEISKENNT